MIGPFTGGISVTPDDVLKTRGLSNSLDDMDMIMSPHGGHLVCVAMKSGVHVCWACCEPFDPEVRAESLLEKLPEGRPGRDAEGHQTGNVPVGVHRKCWNAKDRKVFVDMKDQPRPTALQSVLEVSRGLQLRKLVAKATRALVG